MRECPQCGEVYGEQFRYCPADGSQLALSEENGGEEREGASAAPEPAQISIRTLMLGLGILVLASIIALVGVFLYQYWKPKYGGLVIKTTPPGAIIYIDGRLRGASPIAVSDLRSGGHQLRAVKEGYKEFVQQVAVMPYATENLHWKMEPLTSQLSNEQLAEVEAWQKKLENAQRENILLPPPDDYNVLYFANKILSIDPSNSQALETKSKLAETVRRLAEFAYAREDWLEAEKQYKNLALLFPNDILIGEHLTDIAAKIDASVKDREKQVEDWKAKAEVALKAGNLVPPEKENALDAVRSIQRLDKNNLYAREALARIKELLQSRGDSKISASDWQGARNDFRLMLQYFPEDNYSKTRLSLVEAKLAEAAQGEQQRLQHALEEQQSRQKIAALRQSALNSFRAGSYQKSISDWQEYLKFEPDSDEAYFYLGAVYQEQKQLDTAILDFEKCISLNPNNAPAHVNLGLLYDYHRNNFKQAEEHLRKAKDLGGADKYSPERLQALIQDLQDRAQLSTVLKLSFAVEHKHAFSSCRGNLRFTEEGVEYKANETDHSFYEAYGSLRAFAIERNDLFIKTRNNKKYNFRFLNAADAALVRAWHLSSHYIHVGGQAE